MRAHVRRRQARIDRVEPVLDGVVLHGLGRAAVAGVVDQRVDLAEGLHARGHQILDVGFQGGVADDGNRAAASFLDQPHRLLDQLGRARVAHDPGSLARELQAHHAPDALARSRDDRDLAVEHAHGYATSKRPAAPMPPPMHIVQTTWRAPRRLLAVEYAHGYATSKRPAAPMPPPMHIVQTTWRAPRRLPSISACPTIRAPLMP